MTAEDLRRRKQDIIDREGPWTAHCIHLGDGVYTMDPPFADARMRRFLQVAADISCRPLSQLRVLDLACLEGGVAIEAARHGATVVANEGRAENLAKARFTREVLGLENLELVLDDVRNLSAERYGHFDIVFCLGILYHLDAPAVMEFVEQVASVSRRAAIIDTHISLEGKETVAWRGHEYHGHYAAERFTPETKDPAFPAAWFSLDNPRAFVFTRPSLCNLLRRAGFTSVFECLNPLEDYNLDWPAPATAGRYGVWNNRLTLVAMKGTPVTLLSSPMTNAEPEHDHPELPQYIG